MNSSSDNPTQPGSHPVATGGGGFGFEHRVGAYYLARLLCKTQLQELDHRPIKQVSFQQQAISPIDDLLLSTNDTDPIHLAIECRMTVEFTQRDRRTQQLFEKIIKAYEKAKIEQSHTRFAIVTSDDNNATKEVELLTRVARECSDISAYQRSINQHGQKYNNRLNHIKKLVQSRLHHIKIEPVEIEFYCWALLQKIYVKRYRLRSIEDTDWEHLLDLLTPVAATLSDTVTLRDALGQLAEELAQTAGTVDGVTLRRKLHNHLNSRYFQSSEGWVLLQGLHDSACNSVSKDIKIANSVYHINRKDIVNKIKSEFNGTGGDFIISGPSGSGKSAAILEVLESLDADTSLQIQIINLHDLPDKISVFLDLFSPETLGKLFDDILAPNRLLIIEASEGAVGNKQRVFNYLIEVARRCRIRVGAIVSSESERAVLNMMQISGTDVRLVKFPLLFDHEISHVLQQFTSLRDIATQNTQFYELLQRPIIIRLLIKLAQDPTLELPLSEVSVFGQVWYRLVRKSNISNALADKRESIMQRLALSYINGSPSLPYDSDHQVIAELERDGLLSYAPQSIMEWTTQYKFTHDVLRSYALASSMLKEGNPSSWLEDNHAPLWALTSGKLACGHLLSTAESVTNTFNQLQAGFNRLPKFGYSDRWTDVPTEALLESPNPSMLIETLWDYLLDSEEMGMRRLLRIIDFRQTQLTANTNIAEPLLGLFLSKGIPNAIRDQAIKCTLAWQRAHILRDTPNGQRQRRLLKSVIIRQMQSFMNLTEHDLL